MYLQRKHTIRKNVQRVIGWSLALCMGLLLFLSPDMGMNAQAAKVGAVSSEACQLINKQTIEYFAHLSSLPSSDDNMLYLYQMKTYEYAIADGALPVASCEKTATIHSFSVGFYGFQWKTVRKVCIGSFTERKTGYYR